MPLEGFLQTIKGHVLEFKAKEFMKEISNLQLSYCIHVYEGKIPELLPEDQTNESFNREKSEGNFFNILEKYSDLEGQVYRAYCEHRMIPINIENYQHIKDYPTQDPLYARYKEFIFKSAYRDYSLLRGGVSSERINQWISLLHQRIKQRPEFLPKPLWSDVIEETKEKALTTLAPRKITEPLSFESIKGLDLPELREQNINKDDMVIKLHFKPLSMSKTDGKSFSEIIQDSLEKLATDLVVKHPNAKVIIAESWMLDLPPIKKLGVHFLKSTKDSSRKDSFNTSEFWGQFITKEGKINNERVDQLLKTGKPPFRLRAGYILASDFKSKYLNVNNSYFLDQVNDLGNKK